MFVAFAGNFARNNMCSIARHCWKQTQSEALVCPSPHPTSPPPRWNNKGSESMHYCKGPNSMYACSHRRNWYGYVRTYRTIDRKTVTYTVFDNINGTLINRIPCDQMRWSQNSTNTKIVGHIRLFVLLCQTWKMNRWCHQTHCFYVIRM